jgi:hypothetical protein
MTKRERAIELVRIYGTSVVARERVVSALMQEYGISDQSAVQHFVIAQKLIAGQKLQRRRKGR